MGRKTEVTAFGKEETPTLAGTARYGPVRRVVWDPWLAERCGLASHGDPISQPQPWCGFFPAQATGVVDLAGRYEHVGEQDPAGQRDRFRPSRLLSPCPLSAEESRNRPRDGHRQECPPSTNSLFRDRFGKALIEIFGQSAQNADIRQEPGVAGVGVRGCQLFWGALSRLSQLGPKISKFRAFGARKPV